MRRDINISIDKERSELIVYHEILNRNPYYIFPYLLQLKCNEQNYIQTDDFSGPAKQLPFPT